MCTLCVCGSFLSCCLCEMYERGWCTLCVCSSFLSCCLRAVTYVGLVVPSFPRLLLVTKTSLGDGGGGCLGGWRGEGDTYLVAKRLVLFNFNYIVFV
jgi:hypothetical protein